MDDHYYSYVRPTRSSHSRSSSNEDMLRKFVEKFNEDMLRKRSDSTFSVEKLHWTIRAPGNLELSKEGTVDDDPSITTSKKPSAPCSPDLHVSSNLQNLFQDQSSRPHDIPLQHLKEITNNFSQEQILGQGGFGVVYKFLGYCYETRNACLEYNGKHVFAETVERLLCLEYLPKGSLDKYLSDESSGLDWSTRYKIIKGICYGLCHLHEQIDTPIIHLDLKPANILLDDGMLPKITDFGLSRLLDQQKTICTSSLAGTLGYMAPKFLHGGTITPKSDIFSLGVIIIEILTGHRDYPDVTGTSSDDFIELTLRKWRNVLQRSPGYGSLEKDCEKIKRCLQVGLICVNPDRTKRPPIAKVISMLQGSAKYGLETVF